MNQREFKYKQVIAVRTDLGMSRGKIAVQVAHGSVSAAEKTRSAHPDIWKAWFKEGQKKVAARVSSEMALLELKAHTAAQRLPYALIRDAGMTELPLGTLTALGIGPAKAEDMDRVTGDLKLL